MLPYVIRVYFWVIFPIQHWKRVKTKSNFDGNPIKPSTMPLKDLLKEVLPFLYRELGLRTRPPYQSTLPPTPPPHHNPTTRRVPLSRNKHDRLASHEAFLTPCQTFIVCFAWTPQHTLFCMDDTLFLTKDRWILEYFSFQYWEI